MASNRLGTTLKSLGLALLNATLMLIVIALALSAFVIWQARGLASDIREGVQEQVVMLQTQREETRDTIANAVAALDRLDGAGLRQNALDRPELEGLESAVSRLASSVDSAQTTLQSLAAAEGQNPTELSEVISELIERVVVMGLGRFVEGDVAGAASATN